jgi:hypothetical protein
MAQRVSISPSITPSESISSVSTLTRSIETSTLLPPPARDPDVVYLKDKTYRRNFLVRNKRPRTGWYWKEGTEWDEEIKEKEVHQCWVCRHCVSFHPIRATGANHIKSHLKREHQIKEGDDNIPAFGIRESFALAPEADSFTFIPFDYSISDKAELKQRYYRKTLLN